MQVFANCGTLTLHTYPYMTEKLTFPLPASRQYLKLCSPSRLLHSNAVAKVTLTLTKASKHLVG